MKFRNLVIKTKYIFPFWLMIIIQRQNRYVTIRCNDYSSLFSSGWFINGVFGCDGWLVQVDGEWWRSSCKSSSSSNSGGQVSQRISKPNRTVYSHSNVIPIHHFISKFSKKYSEMTRNEIVEIEILVIISERVFELFCYLILCKLLYNVKTNMRLLNIYTLSSPT